MVLARFRDESLEQRKILALLGMPEHTHREAARWILDRLHGAVVSPGRLAETDTEPTERLMVMRLHGGPVAEDRAHLTGGLDPYVMVGELAGRVQMTVVPDDLGQVLYKVAAERDVQHLATAAHREDGHIAIEGCAEE